MKAKAPDPGLETARRAIFAHWFVLILCGGASAQVTEGGHPIPSVAQIRTAYESALAGRQEISRLVRLAFVASDDADYFDVPSRRSVFTEQVIKSEFLPFAERSLARRERLRVISVRVEQALSHEEILAWYMNGVFLGQGCYGVADAASAYFGLPMNALSIGEAAYISALPKHPSFLNPTLAYDRAIEERDRVIKEMRRLGFISSQAANEALQMELGTLSPLRACRARP